ncbi:NACHT domain-containing protein [Streptomyces sp. NPDC001852]|uniref:NACHT domain-containing protein n=1 Tax=Streptomyces sp. NPDC001852 TaxID=3364619 RepID=UPI0036A73A81
MAAVVALRKPIEGNDAELARGWAKTLARQVETGEGQVRRQLLGADTQRINLAYVLHPTGDRAATAPPAGRTFTDAAASTLPDVVNYYRATRPRRLVITGAGGAGKTVLALELLLALIEDRAEDEPVPVRVPLAQWDTSQPLTDLLVQRLTDTYDWPADLAAALVDQGMVLPVLDGLDEMDPVRDDGAPDTGAPRALAALEALNAYQDGRDPGPLVLTCRTGYYNALGPTAWLVDSARIAIAPVDTERALTYLRDRSRDSSRWQPLLDHLQAQPTGPLAATLSTPWRLCLAATVYHRTGNPTELLHIPTAHDLDQHLLARYIPAATANTPNPRRYPPHQVHRWLHHFAAHLNTQQAGPTAGGDNPAPTRGSRTDLIPHRLWPMAGPRRVRATDSVLTSSLLLIFCLGTALTLRAPAAVTGIAAAAVLDAAFTAGSSRVREPRRPNWRRFRRRHTILLVGLSIVLSCVITVVNAVVGKYTSGFAGGALGGTAGGLGGQIAPTLTLGLALGLVIGLSVSIEEPPSPAARIQDIVRNDLIWSMTIGVLLGSACGIVYGFTYGPSAGAATAVTIGLWCSAGLGTPGVRATSPGRRYLVFVLCSSTQGTTPLRLHTFLNWAAEAGMLRRSGPAYQFRHRELQQWLTHHPNP